MYKRVDKKIRPVSTNFPEGCHIRRSIPEDPLLTLTSLPFNPPEFEPTKKISLERMEILNVNAKGFLLPEEEKLFKHIMVLDEDTIAFEDAERGTLKESYFDPYIFPTLPHTPWEYRNIPIPPGILEKVITLLKLKIAAGVYEQSQSSYRSRWFVVLKKNGKLRIVHDLQPLNKVSVRDAGTLPILDDFVDGFAGHQCYTVFDLYSGFDARKIHIKSRELTAFMTPLGLLQLTVLPQGFTNSPAEFQKCMVMVLQDEIPNTANIFIDDLPIKGPRTQYLDEGGKPEVLKENPGIRRFIWEHAQDVHRIMHRIKCAGATFAATKAQICLPEALIIGQICNANGRVPENSKVDKVLNWPTLTTPKEVRRFLGLCGGLRIWIPNYSKIVRPLTRLYHKDVEFDWSEQCQIAFDEIKNLITTAPALQPINYTVDNPIILAVDSSVEATGMILYQMSDDGKTRHPARFGSVPMSPTESRYSQPKLELFGLYRALRHWRLYIIGVKNLIVEVDAKFIKGMLNEPDLQPNAVINRWIQGIKMFTFELVHVPAERHKGPDALSRRPLGEGEVIEEDDDSWLDNIALMTFIPYRDFPPFPKVSLDFDPQTITLTQENIQDQETIGIPDEEPILHVQKLTDSAKVPMRQTDRAAGYDLYSAETATIEPNSRKLIGTDIAIAIPEGTYARIAARSGLATKYSIDVGAGVIDADFRGEVKILLINNSTKPFEIKKHDRVAQMILEKNMTPEISIMKNLPPTERGGQGIGSTGNSPNHFLETDIILAIKPEFVEAIRTQEKNHEYRKYEIKPTVTRFWLYETEPINAIRYVINVGPIKIPGQVQDPTGLGNDDFDKGLKKSKYAYPILGMQQLGKPLSGLIMEKTIGIPPPHQYEYATAELLSHYPNETMKQIFYSQKLKSQNSTKFQIYATRTTQENNLNQIFKYLTTGEIPLLDKPQAKRRFLNKAGEFLIQNTRMYKKNGNKPPLLVIFDGKHRNSVLLHAHENLGHRGIYAVYEVIRHRFYWPQMRADVNHHVKSCHECQIRSLKRLEIPLTVSVSTRLFAKVYIDVMHMPVANGFHYIVAAKDDLSGTSEAIPLRNATAKALAKFFWEYIYCRYGAPLHVVTDNGPEVKEAFERLLERMNIPQIKITPYNHHANGVVERGHFIIREALIKACKGRISDWPKRVPEILFADRITISRVTGFSPFQLLHATDPLLPLDLAEATFLVEGFKSGMSTEDLLVMRARQLEKHPDDVERAAETLRKARFASKEYFERRFIKRLSRTIYKRGDLVLVQNTKIELSHNRKHQPRYIGPYEVIRRTQGGNYKLKELDGTVMHYSYAAFRILPYITRNHEFMRNHIQINESNQSDTDSESESEPEDSDLED